MFQNIREKLSLALIALLPLHAFGVTVLTKTLEGSGSAPLSVIAVWKEALLLVVLGLAVVEIGQMAISGWRVAVSKNNSTRYPLPATHSFDALDGLILLALLYSLLIHPWNDPTALASYVFGFRYDFVPLVAFLLLRRVSWSPDFLHRAFQILIGVGSLIAVYGLLTLVLPESWFVSLGYSLQHSLYFPDQSLAAFQLISETGIKRIQSTFSGPNQMGLWMLIPLSIVVGFWRRGEVVSRQWSVVSFLLLFSAILLSFSRAAWIGAFVVTVFLWIRTKHSSRTKNGALMHQKNTQTERNSRFFLGIVTAMCLLIVMGILFPDIFLRPISSSAHFTRPIEAIRLIAEHPFGLGLGSAGPASNRISDTCVELPLGADYVWTETVPNLCVIVGGVQMLPPDRVCNCPVIPENWYLQWGVEMGVVGLLVYVLLTFFVLRRLVAISNWQLAAVFLAISIAALFLHAFEDSAVSYTLWILLSATIPPWKVQTAPSSSLTSADSTRI